MFIAFKMVIPSIEYLSKIFKDGLFKRAFRHFETMSKKRWINIMTGDSSWFQLKYGNDGTWIMPDDKPPEMD